MVSKFLPPQIMRQWTRRSVLGVHWKDWCWNWNSNALTTSCEELTHWKRPWCWEGLGAGGEGDDRGWDSWMALLTRWTWVWVNSGSWWWTGRPGVLWFMESQRIGHDWATELNWTELNTSVVAQTVKNLPEMGETGFEPWVGKIPWRRTLQLISVLLLGESHEQRSLAGDSPWGGRGSDMTEHNSSNTLKWLSLTIRIPTFLEYNPITNLSLSTSPQYLCLFSQVPDQI